MSSTTTTRTRRTNEEWDAIARELLPEVQAGTATLEDFRGRVGSNPVSALRTAFARIGYDSHGKPLAVTPVTARSPSVLARRVAKRRRDGAPWWLVLAETGKSYAELTRLLEANGFTHAGTEASSNGALQQPTG